LVLETQFPGRTEYVSGWKLSFRVETTTFPAGNRVSGQKLVAGRLATGFPGRNCFGSAQRPGFQAESGSTEAGDSVSGARFFY
jgi:hypothetical protein